MTEREKNGFFALLRMTGKKDKATGEEDKKKKE